MVGERVLNFWWRAVAIASYHSQVHFFFVVCQVTSGIHGQDGGGWCGG